MFVMPDLSEIKLCLQMLWLYLLEVHMFDALMSSLVVFCGSYQLHQQCPGIMPLYSL